MTIILEILNFKCWDNKIINLPSCGLVLLNGDSGKGKTSILKAIYFALYGKISNESITRWGEKVTIVKLKSNGIIITRKTHPYELIVNYNDKLYNDVEAQEIINSIWGKDFLYTSYITQDQVSNFINMKPSDQLEWLEKYAFGTEFSPDVIREKLKKEKTKLFKDIHENEHILKTLLNIQPKKPMEIIFSKGKYSLKKANKYLDKYNITEKNIITYKDALNNLKLEQIQNEANIKISNQIQDELKRVDQEIETIKLYEIDNLLLSNLKLDLDYLDNYSKVIQYETDLKKYEEIMKEHNSQIVEKKKNLTLQLRKIPTEIDSHINILTQLSQLQGGNTQELTTEINTLEKQLSNKTYQCPCCKETLIIRDEKLLKTDIPYVNQSSKYLNNKLKEATLKKHKIDEDNKKIKELTSKITLKSLRDSPSGFLENPSGSVGLPILKENLETLNQYKSQLHEIEYQMKQLPIEPDHMVKEKKRLDILSHQLSSREKRVVTQSRDDIIKQISIINSKIEKNKEMNIKLNQLQCQKDKYNSKKIVISTLNYPEKIKKIEDNLNKSIVKFEKLKSIKENIIQYQIYLKQLEEYNKHISTQKSKQYIIDELRKAIENIDKIITKVNKNELLSIKNILNILNTQMKFYLDQFFNDTILVELQFGKESKSGDVKPCLIINISYKGHVGVKMHDLSGGESDRVALCTFLALNELTHSKMLFLDESISSLHNEMSHKIMECIKNNIALTKVVVCINHNTIEGLYDEVINV